MRPRLDRIGSGDPLGGAKTTITSLPPAMERMAELQVAVDQGQVARGRDGRRRAQGRGLAGAQRFLVVLHNGLLVRLYGTGKTQFSSTHLTSMRAAQWLGHPGRPAGLVADL